MKACFAQFAEDLVLAEAFGDQKRGFYVDVGASHPTSFSVTKMFYDRGWHGINIEPLPHMYEALKSQRPLDTNLRVAVSDVPGALTFHQVSVSKDRLTKGTGLSTLDPDLARSYAMQGRVVTPLHVPVRTLSEILAEYPVPVIDFLKLDVEGHELSALRGLDLRRFRPRILLIEATRPQSDIPTFADWESRVLDGDYLFACDDGTNRYYVRSEDAPLVARLRPLAPDEYVRISDSGVFTGVKWWIKPLTRRLGQWLSGNRRAA